MHLGMLSNVHRNFHTYQCIHLNIFRMDSPNTSIPRGCHLPVTLDSDTVYKNSLIHLNLVSRYTSKPVAYTDISQSDSQSPPRRAQTTQVQPGSVTERFGHFDISHPHQSPPRRAVFIPYVPPDPRVTLTYPPGSFPPMPVRVPRTQPSMTTASQPHVSDTQPPDLMDDEDDQ